MGLPIGSRIVLSRRDRIIRATGGGGATLSGPAPEGRWLLPCWEVGVNQSRKSKQPVSRDAHNSSLGQFISIRPRSLLFVTIELAILHSPASRDDNQLVFYCTR
jgi:hypothetical protein